MFTSKKSEQDAPENKNSIFKHLRLAFLLLVLLFLATPHLRTSLVTINQNPELYSKHFSVSASFPFVGAYYLMQPANYDERKSYPLVVSLHGVSVHSYPAEALAQQSLRRKFPAFVLVPIAPGQSFWATPEDSEYSLPKGFLPWPDHLPFVMNAIRSTQSSYKIDPSRIYITGHSMGGAGVIGALERYPDVFAAGISSAGIWSPTEISNIKAPLYLLHGKRDNAIPVTYSQQLGQAGRELDARIYVQLFDQYGHEIGGVIYKNDPLWKRLFKIRKK